VAGACLEQVAALRAARQAPATPTERNTKNAMSRFGDYKRRQLKSGIARRLSATARFLYVAAGSFFRPF
jgi:hypothetical protein